MLLVDSLKENLRSLLKSNGLRDTPERYIILKEICEEDDSFTAYDIYYKLDEKKEDISIATVYNNLSLFCKIGIIKKVPSCDNNTLYDLVE